MALTVSIDALRPEIWAKELYADVIDNMFFTRNGLMGTGTNNIVEMKDELMKSKGDTITVPLTTKMTGDGEVADDTLEGNEEAISSFSESILIDQQRFAVRMTGRLDEQKVAYNMRMDSKDKLSIRMQEFIERQIFFKLAGVNNTTITDVNGVVVGGRAAWSNAPAQVPYADSAAGSGDRYLCANAGGADALLVTDLITPALISRAKVKAILASPKIMPLRIDGKDYYVLFISPWQAYDLKRNAEFTQAQREAMPRSSDNPIFTGALGVWDGVVIHEHEYVPFLDVSAVGNNFNAAGAGTDFLADTHRALLCGRQAAAYAKTTEQIWVEEDFDYKNQVGFATGIIGGIQKISFDSKDYGVIALDTAATDLS